jgi:predicted metal-dependent hydrolase
MTTLHVRRPPFDFEGDVPFCWNPENPAFSLLTNAVSVIAISFERYIVTATRQALPFITDPAVAAEADAFLRQEAQHASAHRLHMRALSRSYPGLQQTIDQANACYDERLLTKPLKYHLAYAADLEATFTPTFKLWLDHEEQLFRPGDERVASLFLWHFVEEIEHRGSALLIYRTVVGSEAYRLSVLPSVARHILRLLRVIVEGFNTHVPFEHRRVDARFLLPTLKTAGSVDPMACVPSSARRAALWRFLASQVPNHDPEHQPLPRFADLWLERHARGDDVVRWYSSGR